VKATVIVLTLAVAVIGPAASAQTVDQPIADRLLLNAELERGKQLGIASVDDARAARLDERKTNVSLASSDLHR
jgi:hypothetical protein